MAKEDTKAIPVKETKPETEDTKSTTPKTTSKGEYKEDAKKAMGSYYGKDVEITDENYSGKMEEMVAKGFGPMQKQNNEYKTIDKSYKAMMQANPAMGGIMDDMGAGAGFEESLPKYVDLEAIADSKGGNPEKYAEQNKTRMANYDKVQTRKSLLATNEKKSIETVKTFMAEKKMEGENADKFGKYVADVIDRANSGELTTDFLETMYNAMNYVADVAQAKEIGEVGGRNAKIESKTKSEKDLQVGDGVPKIATGDDKVTEKSNSSEDELADLIEGSFNKKKDAYRNK